MGNAANLVRLSCSYPTSIQGGANSQSCSLESTRRRSMTYLWIELLLEFAIWSPTSVHCNSNFVGAGSVLAFLHLPLPS